MPRGPIPRGPDEQGHLDATVGADLGHFPQFGLGEEHGTAALRDPVHQKAQRIRRLEDGGERFWALDARDFDPEMGTIREPVRAGRRCDLGLGPSSARRLLCSCGPLPAFLRSSRTSLGLGAAESAGAANRPTKARASSSSLILSSGASVAPGGRLYLWGARSLWSVVATQALRLSGSHAAVTPSSSTRRRRCSRQRARVGPMLPIGICRSRERSL